MGKITLTVEGTTVGTVAEGRGIVVTKEVSEADSARLIAAYARSYADRFKNEDGTPRQPTVAEVVTEWFDGVVAGSRAHVFSVEQEVEAEKGRAKVQPIEITSAQER